ncbi:MULTISPECIES: hypothetical protein [unclassified Isoptericola]|uniref:hypothetical protein n=1 Tax=unclassified Isoptericola TaxID=2623355 RepID=UPI002713D2B6|nr:MULTISPECIES: hypothetical protein [unclassified Isoptericola]MDO8145915.1 hypothetical protein [Isoptericola sp. 178]MDO8147766.1 hypothetical protein [Isoptericola sp. b515]
MLRVMTYEVREDAVGANTARVRDVVAALEARGHAGTYLSAHVAGTGRFVHVVDPRIEGVLDDLPEFAAFRHGLRGVLVAGPVAHQAAVVAGAIDGAVTAPSASV